MPQLLPPVAWYFGGSVKLELFNSLNDFKIIRDIGCDYCLDISHAFMCAFQDKDFLSYLKIIFIWLNIFILLELKDLMEGESLKKMTKLQEEFLNEVINIPYIKVIEVWQGHLNNFLGFKTAICELEEIVNRKS